jgi:hypothetical protein
MKVVPLALVAMIAAGPAQAACGLPNVAGKWTALILASTGATVTTTGCDLTISNTGALTGTCADSTGAQPVPTGTAAVLNAQKCLFNGTLTLGTTVHTVNLAAMTNDKQTVQGIGTLSTGGGFQLSMIKQAGRKGPGGGSD